MNDDTKKALDDRIRWINEVTDLARQQHWVKVGQAIEQVDDEHLRSLMWVLINARVDDYDRVSDHYREWMRERMNEWPMQSPN